MELVHAHINDFNGIVADLSVSGLKVASCGARVRVPTACGGCEYNPNGLMDAQASALEVDEKLFSDEIKVLQKLAKRIEKEIKDMLGVTCTAKLVEPKTIQRSEGKAKRVIDNRNL